MRALLLAAVACAAASSPAYAGGEMLDVDECPVAADLTPEQMNAVASEHYERGGVLYYQGDYEGAIREFVGFLCLLPSGTSALFSIAQSYERLLDFERAIAYYHRYLDALGEAAPAAERRNVNSRITVLEGLPARIRITTTPPGATVSFTDTGGVRRNYDKTSEEAFEVHAGTYTMRVALPGYVAVEQTVEPRIGQPYSYFFALEPKKGHLVVNADPVDARIFVDDRLVGIGRYESDVPGATYQVTVEANGRVAGHQAIEVVADRTTEVPIKLEHTPKSGRTQLLISAGVGGGFLGGVALGVLSDSTGTAGLGALGGILLGVVGAYFGVPHDIEVGESWYVITCALAGAIEAGFAAGIFVDGQTAPDTSPTASSVTSVGAVTIGGMAAGAIFGAATASRFHLDAGDAALLNTGALWGGIGGGLFSAIFEFKPRVSEGLVLGGLNLGLVTGALLGRRVEVSRGHVALIDLAGFAGMGIAVAMQSAIDSARGITTPNAERKSHFALGGMAIGLTAGAFMTRKMDAPKARVSPAITTALDAGGHATPVLGFGGQF